MARWRFAVSVLAVCAGVLAGLWAGLWAEFSAGIGAAAAETTRTDTPSGFPVPRFAVFKYEKTSCRSGPSFSHPVAMTYLRAGLPVQIVAETRDHWRRIRDVDGVQCWAHKTTLRSAPRVLAIERLAIRADPSADARIRAYVEPGVIMEVKSRRGEWALADAGSVRGWALRSGLWGAVD